MTKPTVCLRVTEYADAYALRTLYDYLVETEFPAKIVFSNLACVDKFKKILRGVPIVSDLDSMEGKCLEIGGYCDVSSIFADRRILIDMAVLKNCASPVTPEQREQLCREYDIKTGKPVLVISFTSSNCLGGIEEVVASLHRDAQIYIAGSVTPLLHESECYAKWSKTNIVPCQGNLRDYYALADLAIMGTNRIMQIGGHLHNFVEASGGGPLFLVSPSVQTQYGYAQLKKARVIREAREKTH